MASRCRSLLAAAIPEQHRTTIFHGDYRIDNALLRLPVDGQPEVAAIVDWELSTIGDPIADVATMCAYRHEAFDLMLGFPTAWTSGRLDGGERLAGRYETAGRVKLENWDVISGWRTSRSL